MVIDLLGPPNGQVEDGGGGCCQVSACGRDQPSPARHLIPPLARPATKGSPSPINLNTQISNHFDSGYVVNERQRVSLNLGDFTILSLIRCSEFSGADTTLTALGRTVRPRTRSLWPLTFTFNPLTMQSDRQVVFFLIIWQFAVNMFYGQSWNSC